MLSAFRPSTKDFQRNQGAISPLLLHTHMGLLRGLVEKTIVRPFSPGGSVQFRKALKEEKREFYGNCSRTYHGGGRSVLNAITLCQIIIK